MLGIIKKKERSIIKKTNHNATEPQQVNSGWKEITSAPKESVAIHKETASGWELITKLWKKTPQPTPKPDSKPDLEIEKKSPKSLIAEKPVASAAPQSSKTPPESAAQPESSDKSSQTVVAQPTVIGRPTPVSKKTGALQSAVKPETHPPEKKKLQSRPRLKPSSAEPKTRPQQPQTPAAGTPDITGVAGKLSDGWEELAAGWGQAPDGWDVTAPHHDDTDEKIELHFRKNVHTLSKILKEMSDELFLAIQQRDDQILFVRTELQKYKNKAKRLERTVQQQWSEEVLRVRDKEVAKAQNEMKIYKAKADRLEKTLAIQDEYTYERLLSKYDRLVRDILVKRTLNNEQKMRHLMLIAHHLGIPHGESIRMIRDKVNKIMAQVNRL